MKRSASSITFFVVGFIVCALTLRTLYGSANLPFTGNDSKAKAAVLASLNTTSSPVQHFTGDTVVADAAAKLEPAIVEVHTVGKAVQQSNPFGDDQIMRQFFGRGFGGGAPVQPKGAGSGVIISADGYILTNNHVVENTETVTVKVGDKGYIAKVIGTDPMSDIAVVKIKPDGKPFPVAELGNSDNCRIGDWAIAIGNPLDIGTTVTLGIVSAINRTGLSAESHPLQSVIQTDAAINPGNSGGALANINGQVIGINEAIYSPTGSYVGIGFAIPINTAKKIAAELIKDGKVVRPYLGVSYAPLKIIPKESRQKVGITLQTDNGVVIQQVYEGSPAAKAGLQLYDVVLQANKQPINDIDMLNTIIQKSKVGDTMTLLVSRDGQNIIIPVTLRERPADFGQRRQMQQQMQQDPDMTPDQP